MSNFQPETCFLWKLAGSSVHLRQMFVHLSGDLRIQINQKSWEHQWCLQKQPSHSLQWGRTKISRYVWGQGATPTSLQLFKNSGAGWLEEWSETLGASLTLLSCKLTYPHPRIPKVYLKIWRYFFLFPRWDMLVPPRYLTPKTARHSTKPSANPSRKLSGCSWAGTTAD